MARFSFRPRWLARAANAVLVGTIHSEDRHPISRPLMRLYHPVVEFALRFRGSVVASAVLVVLGTGLYAWLRPLGSEFMPPLNEGALLYMPTTLPGISVTEAARMLQVQDRVLKSFPEVERVSGKVGRADGRRHCHVVRDGAHRVSGHLRDLEMALGGASADDAGWLSVLGGAR